MKSYFVCFLNSIIGLRAISLTDADIKANELFKKLGYENIDYSIIESEV